MTLTEKLKGEHLAVRKKLEEFAALPVPELITQLQSMAPEVIAHLDLKDRLYAEARKVLVARGDAGGAAVLGIFEQNMRVLAGGIRAFFAEFQTLIRSPQVLLRRFSTVCEVLKNLFDTEEKAVLPLFARCQDALS